MHSAITTVAQEQKLAGGISSQPEAREQVEKHHAEFKQLASQCNDDVGMFEVTLHHTVVRPEEEEVDIGETEKYIGQFSECPPCQEGGEIKLALRWSSQPIDVPVEQRAAN